MSTILPTPGRTSVRPRRYAPKGNRPLRTTGPQGGIRHAFLPHPFDQVSCVHCSLPVANWRHQEPPQGRAA